MSRDPDGIIKIKYANSGDVGLGGLNLNNLWPIGYSTPGGTFPQRIQFNQLFRYVSALGVEINNKGPFLEYDGTALIAPDYAVGAVVRGSDSELYECLIANGPASSIVDPVGDSTGRWILAQLDDQNIYKGHLDGGFMSNGTDTQHDIDVSDIVVGLSDGAGNYRLFSDTSPPTKKIDANWAEGDDAGGFPSGLSIAADTEYNFFIIGKDNGDIDAGFDTSLSATNLLADATDYDWYRRIGSVFTQASSNILGFVFDESKSAFLYNSSITDVSDNTLAGAFETGTLSVPPNKTAIIECAVEIDDEDNSLQLRAVGGDRQTVILNFGTTTTATVSLTGLTGVTEFLIDSNSQLQYAAPAGTGGLSLKTHGWIDNRR